jgi:hypothetical protein
MRIIPSTFTAASFCRQYVGLAGFSLFQYFFDLTDFLLDLASEFFVLAFGLKVRVVRNLPRFFFNVTFHFVQLAFDLVCRARFHTSSCSLFKLASLRPIADERLRPQIYAFGVPISSGLRELAQSVRVREEVMP